MCNTTLNVSETATLDVCLSGSIGDDRPHHPHFRILWMRNRLLFGPIGYPAVATNLQGLSRGLQCHATVHYDCRDAQSPNTGRGMGRSANEAKQNGQNRDSKTHVETLNQAALIGDRSGTAR